MGRQECSNAAIIPSSESPGGNFLLWDSPFGSSNSPAV